MRTLSLILGILCTQSLWALPVIGEKVVYTGEVTKPDGLYQVRRTDEITNYDMLARKFTIKRTYEQWGEGAPLGLAEQVGEVSENQFLYFEQQLIPALMQNCGGPIQSADGRFQAMTNKDFVLTGLGPVQSCKLDILSMAPNQGKVINWWATETAPWPVKIIEKDMAAGVEMTVTLQSLTRPSKP